MQNPDDVPVQLKRITVEFKTDRAVTHELVRHRKATYSQRSQRYVRENDIDFILPVWWNTVSTKTQEIIKASLAASEVAYRNCLKTKHNDAELIAEQARIVLPNATATIIIVTASVPEWQFIFKLRTSKAAYPQIRELMAPVKQIFQEHSWTV